MNPSEPASKSFFEHLDELRGRLVVCVSAVAVTTGVCYSFVGPILDDILKPAGRVVFTSPSEAFLARLQLSIILGCVTASPLLFYHVWKFVETALKDHEKKFIRMFAAFSLVLFVAGVAFAYFVAIPFTMKFLLGFQSDRMIPMITVTNYMSFVTTTILAFGVLFEMPLVMAFLTGIGIATPAFLIQKRRHAIILILIVAAIVTPPDVISQIVMSVPLIILYEVGILASCIVFRRSQ